MATGRINLVTRGLQDELVTGSPDVTLFSKTFAKETKYETFILDNSTNGEAAINYGTQMRFIVPRKGDLLSKIFIRIILPATYLYTGLQRVYTDNFHLYSIIETADLYIGKQLIERLTGEYIHNYIKLYFSKNELNSIVKTTEINTESGTQTYIRYDQFVLLPLPFYFYDKPGKEIPLVSLTKQDVEIVINFVPKPPINALPDINTVTIPVEYVLLDDTVKTQFRQSGLLYKVEQVQMQHGTIDMSETFKSIKLDFVNPVKEISLCIQSISYTNYENSRNIKYFCNYRNEFMNYSNVEVGYYLQAQHIKGMDLLLNGNKIISHDAGGHCRYLSAYLPMKYYSNPDNSQFFKQYVYPFVQNPLDNHTVGHVNMSRIIDKQLDLHLYPSDEDRVYRVYATSYNLLMIKNDIAGLMFTHNSDYDYNIPRGVSDVATVETNTPPAVLPDTDGTTFYYAITTEGGLLGTQLFTTYTPVFSSSTSLININNTQLFSVDNVYVNNIAVLDPNVYAPATKINFIDDIDTNITVTNYSLIDKYQLNMNVQSETYVFSSNNQNALSLRLSMLTNTSRPGTTDYNPVTTADRNLFSNLDATTNVLIYRSTEFFDPSDVPGWIAGATLSQKTIRTDYKTQSDGYYYLANVQSIEGIYQYNDVLFGRTYDFNIFFDITEFSESLDTGTNTSTITVDIEDIEASRTSTIEIYSDAARTILLDTQTSTGSSTFSYTFEETRLRTNYTYYFSFSDGVVNIETTKTVLAGKQLTMTVDSSSLSNVAANVTLNISNLTSIGTLTVYNDAGLSNSLVSQSITTTTASPTFVETRTLGDYTYYVDLVYGASNITDSILVTNAGITPEWTFQGKTVSYPSGEFFDTSGLGDVRSVTSKSDGLLLVVHDRDGSGKLKSISGSNAWELSTMTATGSESGFLSDNLDALGISSEDGLTWYLSSNADKRVYEYATTSAWDVTTLITTRVSRYFVPSDSLGVYTVSNYVYAVSGNDIRLYDTSSGFTFIDEYSPGLGDIQGVVASFSGKTVFFIAGDYNLYEVNVPNGFSDFVGATTQPTSIDLNSLITDKTSTLALKDITIDRLTGTNLIVCDRPNDRLYYISIT